jgi:hypothetical protein
MAERTILVCDVCGVPATETVAIRVGSRNLLKDLCKTHLAALVEGTRRPKRGRKPGSKSATKSTAARPRAKRATAKGARRGPRRKAAEPPPEEAPTG